MKIKHLILKLSEYESIDTETFNSIIKNFEKTIKKQINNYECKNGLEDYKMKKSDYIILLHLYENTKKSKYKISLLLLYMYSFYKLDGFDFDKSYFPFKKLFDFIYKNDNIHSVMFKIINDDNKFNK